MLTVALLAELDSIALTFVLFLLANLMETSIFTHTETFTVYITDHLYF